MSSPATLIPPAAASAPSQYMQRLQNLMHGTPLPLLVAFLVIIIVGVVVYLIMKFKKDTLQSQDLLSTPVIIANPLTGNYNISAAGNLPASLNGVENTISIWLYVDNISITDDHKIVLYRGNSTSFSNGVFFVYMDKKTNKLYASLRTNGALDETASSAEPTLEGIRTNTSGFMQSVIEYIPLQRWVNVSYTVKDTVFSTYLDGELYSVTSIYEMPTKSDGTRPQPQKPTGDIMLGGKALKQGFDGYIGTGTYYNFAITLQEAKIIYKKGPYRTSWLSYLGLGNVGFRSPVYEITADSIDVKK
jgi:hypothetical protein